VSDPPNDAVERLLKWLEKHVTEQRAIGLQPIAILLLVVLLVWCIASVGKLFH
jgi:hypothetical protein